LHVLLVLLMVLLEPLLESLKSLPVIVSVELAAGCVRRRATLTRRSSSESPRNSLTRLLDRSVTLCFSDLSIALRRSL
jgi:hypothetical protein